MRDAFKYLTSVIFAAVVVQVALAGYGAFYAVDKADDNDSVSKDAVEHGFNAHAILGTIIVVVMLLLLIVALAGRLGSRWVIGRLRCSCSGSCRSCSRGSAPPCLCSASSTR